MQLTIPAKGQRDKVKFNFSPTQIKALAEENFASVEDARGELGKQAKQVLTSLVALELFTVSVKGVYKRTSWGKTVAAALSERV